MNKIQPLENLSHDISRDFFRYFLRVSINNISQWSSIHELNQHEKTIHVVIWANVIYDVFVGAHGHNCGLNLYLLEHLFVWNFHDSDGYTFGWMLSVVGFINRAHSTLPQLFSKSIDFIGITGNEVYFLYLFLEIIVCHKVILWNLVFLLQTVQDGNESLWIFLNFVWRYIIFVKHFHHIRRQPFNTVLALQIDLQVNFMLEIGRSKVIE